MQVTSSTKYEDFRPFEECLTPEGVQTLTEAAERQYGAMHNLTIDEFFGIMNGDLSILGDLSEPKVLQVYWQKRFSQFCDEFATACERMTIQDTEQEQMQNGCLPMSPVENVLTFTREYFGLPSFTAAGKRTIGEYLVARKDKYNQARVQRNYLQAQRKKFSKKR